MKETAPVLELDTHAAITSLLVEFAWRIDHTEGHGVEDLFTHDGVYVLFGHPVEGRENIKALYDHRRSRGPRTSRHIFDNIRITQGRTDSTVLRDTRVLHGYSAYPVCLHG